jgi:hypothetical protein
VAVVSGLLFVGLAGCTSAVPSYRGLYEGLQTREEMVNPSPTYRAADRRPTYPEYEAARRRLLDEEPAK